jgi:hypothetical protein
MSDSSNSNGNGGVPKGMASAANTRQAHLAFERILPEMLEVPEDDLPVINFDTIVLTNSILKAVPTILAKRHLFEQVRPFLMRWVDHLEDYGLTLGHTQAVVRFAEVALSGIDLAFLLDQHESLIRDAISLEGRKLLDPVGVSKLPRSTTQSQVGHDVLAITNFFLSSWSRLEGRCPVTKEELEEVRERANMYILATTLRGDQQTSLVEALLNRRRAAYLALRAYRHIRAALMLLLDDREKVDAIAPPLGRTKRKAHRNTSPSEPAAFGVNNDVDGEDEEPEQVDFGAPANAAAPRAAAEPEAPAAPVRPGMPGSSPTLEDEE